MAFCLDFDDDSHVFSLLYFLLQYCSYSNKLPFFCGILEVGQTSMISDLKSRVAQLMSAAYFLIKALKLIYVLWTVFTLVTLSSEHTQRPKWAVYRPCIK